MQSAGRPLVMLHAYSEFQPLQAGGFSLGGEIMGRCHFYCFRKTRRFLQEKVTTTAVYLPCHCVWDFPCGATAVDIVFGESGKITGRAVWTYLGLALTPPPPSSTTTPPQASCASVKAPSRVVRSIHPPAIYLLSSQAVAAMEKPAFTVKRPCDNRRRATFRTASLSTSPADHTMGQLLDMSHGLKAPLPDNFAYFPKRFCHTANRQM